ncbi:MAPEG family protein [Octadecabacter sp. 1_MG-2023]|uniref:MAPEG family protein n=1 Tax=unclassified Octadecabacter TaxID=196158 RepID=UPI00209188AF|nr:MULTISPECIES: MAPEG family protein [unclassified Octadecabacter]MDO6733639.1 MAPEG family protein [Octadecabacter sp. 1_MG-2023]
MLTLTSLYAGLLAMLYLALSWRVIQGRFAAGVSLGDGDDKPLQRRMRAHGNAGENIPLGLILLALVEVQGAPVFAVHGLGVMLLVGRVLHGVALTRSTPWPFGRSVGMGLTYLMMILTSLGLVTHAIF